MRTVLVACLLLVVGARWSQRAEAQVYGEMLPPPPRFLALTADLEAAGVDVPPVPLVEAYRSFLVRWDEEQSAIRESLFRTTGADVRAVHGPTTVDRAMQLVRRARALSGGCAEALFDELSRHVTDEQQPGLGRAREWRRTELAIPYTTGSFLRLNDVGALVRQQRLTDDERRVALDALATSESERRRTLEAVQAAMIDARRAAARVAEDAGVVGTGQAIGGERGPEVQATRRAVADAQLVAQSVSGDVLASAIEAQLKAFAAVEKGLPKRVRRAAFDAIVLGLIADQTNGAVMGLPLHSRSPADLGRRVLAAKGLSEERREATRMAIETWMTADDAIVVAGLEATIRSLRGGETTSREVLFRESLELQRQRGEEAQGHLKEVVAASGAEWLLDSSIPPPDLDEAELDPSDRDLLGVERPRAPTVAATSVSASRRSFLPFPLDDEARARLVQALDLEESEQARVATVLETYALRWETEMRPRVETAQTLDRMTAGGPSGNDSASFLSNLRELRTTRLEAFARADALEAELEAHLVATLGAAREAGVHRSFAARRVADWSHRVHDSFQAVGVDIAHTGGGVCNVAAAIAADSVSPERRAAVDAALASEWPALQVLSREMRAALIDAAYGERAMYGRRIESDVDDREEDRVATASIEPSVRSDALVPLLERWRRAESMLVSKAIEAAFASGDGEGSVRDALDRLKYPGYFHLERTVAGAMRAIEASEEFEGRPELLVELELCRRSLLDLARRRAELARPTVDLGRLSAEDRRFAGDARGWRDQHCMLMGLEVHRAAGWLTRHVVPDAMADAMPALRDLGAH